MDSLTSHPSTVLHNRRKQPQYPKRGRTAVAHPAAFLEYTQRSPAVRKARNAAGCNIPETRRKLANIAWQTALAGIDPSERTAGGRGPGLPPPNCQKTNFLSPAGLEL